MKSKFLEQNLIKRQSAGLNDAQGDNLTGHFLIAMPSLQDDNFHQTVTLICEHNEEGVMGITLNRKSQFMMTELFNELNVEITNYDAHMLFEGGPMQPENGFILHRHNKHQKWENTIKVTEDICLTTSKDIIEAIAINKGPSDFHISLGYAGWSAEQLQIEMIENSWLTTPATADKVFNTDADAIWTTSAHWLGISMSQLTPNFGRA